MMNKKLWLVLLLLFPILLLASCDNNSVIKQYTVTFDYGDSMIESYSNKVNENEKITEPDQPIWLGYDFGGWYSSSDFDESSRWIFSTYVIQKDTTLYAKWDKVIENNEELIVTKSHKEYLQGTEFKFDVYKYETNKPGPTIFIMGGIHGDERAGWNAALRMIDYNFTRGTVYVLPIANGKAASNKPYPTRHFGQDLNRQFPGKINGTDTQVLAYWIYKAIKDTNPDLVLDLHESRGSYLEDDGYLGNQIILHHGMYNLYVQEVLDTFNKLDLMEGKLQFRLDGHPPIGSINRTFTDNEGIPVFTVETNRGGLSVAAETISLESRIAEQLAIIKIILNSFEVI